MKTELQETYQLPPQGVFIEVVLDDRRKLIGRRYGAVFAPVGQTPTVLYKRVKSYQERIEK